MDFIEELGGKDYLSMVWRARNFETYEFKKKFLQSKLLKSSYRATIYFSVTSFRYYDHIRDNYYYLRIVISRFKPDSYTGVSTNILVRPVIFSKDWWLWVTQKSSYTYERSKYVICDPSEFNLVGAVEEVVGMTLNPWSV
jgi:hypothetical protein